MAADKTGSGYALGYTDAEHARLIYQAARLAPLTERVFREAGIASGQRVLDIGSGVGDVAILAAKMVGPAGEIVGIERDARSIARARARVAEAQLHNVTFLQSDVSQIPEGQPFDAAVGLPPPAMHLDMPLGTDPQFVGWICDLLLSLQPQARQHNVSLEKLGDLTTLSDRLRTEVVSSKTVVAWIGFVSAWTRKPAA